MYLRYIITDNFKIAIVSVKKSKKYYEINIKSICDKHLRSKLILFLRKLPCIKPKYKNSIITLLNKKIEYRAK